MKFMASAQFGRLAHQYWQLQQAHAWNPDAVPASRVRRTYERLARFPRLAAVANLKPPSLRSPHPEKNSLEVGHPSQGILRAEQRDRGRRG
jgi:hypothetical protein